MSSTITETERRSMLKTSAADMLAADQHETLLNKRLHLSRNGSIEKLKKFNSYICSQHYYILPSLLLWLKTSQTILTASMEKCINFLKSVLLMCTLRDLALFKTSGNHLQGSKYEQFSVFRQLAVQEMQATVSEVVQKLSGHLAAWYTHVKHHVLVAAVYLGVFVVCLQLVGCAMLICSRIPPLGFVFLVLCVAAMAHIVSHIMLGYEHKVEKPAMNAGDRKPENEPEKKRYRKRLSLIGKTISNIKLF